MQWLVIGASPLAASELLDWLLGAWQLVKVLLGFSAIIFVHELGHFLAAKWVGVRVDRFAIGFFTRVIGYRKGEGLTLGPRPDYTPAQLAERRLGETDYCINLLPLGGYVKMLGEHDIEIDEKTNRISIGSDPRAFPNRPVWQRMLVVSAGVVFNLIFAALLLVGVFTIGRDVPAPIVGWVAPDTPAHGRLLPGDEILRVDGKRMDSLNDVIMAVVFSDGSLRMDVKRGGEILPASIEAPYSERAGARALDILPMTTTTRTADGFPLAGEENLRKGDRVLSIDGREVKDALEILHAFQQSGGRVLDVLVERPGANPGDPPQRVLCKQRAILDVQPADLPSDRTGNDTDNGHILGWQMRRVIGWVDPKKPAAKAGYQVGDIVVEWGGIPHPLFGEIKSVISEHAGVPFKTRVLRKGSIVEIEVTPTSPFALLSKPAPPTVGLGFNGRRDEEPPVVADTAPNTPAAALRMPRGSQILSIDGREMTNWFDVVGQLESCAGRGVEVRYRTGGVEVAGTLAVPSSMVNELGMPGTSVIRSIDGESEVRVSTKDGEKSYSLMGNTAAVRALLAQKIGRTVRVRYTPDAFAESREAEFTVREDNTDPWQLRMTRAYDLNFEPVMRRLSSGGNPMLALSMGVNQVSNAVGQIYLFLSKLALRDVGVSNVAGPVGIVQAGVEQARQSWSDLLFFLAFLSINLAVINFLPLPVMDGGQMVFLLIELVRRRPLSFKTQTIATLVGLAAIVLGFICVTIQDISRFL